MPRISAHLGPTALDGSHRGDENAVHIEENSLAGIWIGEEAMEEAMIRL